MGRSKVINLKPENYSKMLKDFSEKFSKDFPDDYDTWEKLDLTMEAWNTANFKKLVPEDVFMKSASLLEELNETSQLFNKMVDYKLKNYFEFDKFMLDYDLDMEVEPPTLEVSIGDMDAYLKVLEEIESEEEEEFIEDLTRRNAIILKPKKLFVNWIDQFEDVDDFIYESRVYLVDDEVFDLEDWIDENFEELFERELELGSFDEINWPQNRTCSMFKKWFKIDFSTTVYDLEDF